MSTKKGIVVKLYQDLNSNAQDAGEPDVHADNYGKLYTAEELIILACKKRRIGPSGFYIFGLRESRDGGRWLPPNGKIECTENELKEYVLRIRFIPSLSGLPILGKECKEAFNYFFLQCRHDFVKDNITLKKKIGQECILGLGVLDMLRWGKENHYDILYLKKEEPRNFIPASSKRRFKSPWDKSKLKSNVNSELEKLFTASVTVIEYKVRYIHGFIKYCEQYGIEKFRTTTPNETVVVDPHHEEYSAIYLQKEKEDEIVGICSIQDVMFINKGSLPDKHQVTISRKHGGKPETLYFSSESDADAFISVVDGYHRLVDDFHYQVCPEISSPIVEQLSRIKSHGPVSQVWAVERLRRKHGIQQEFNFLLRQHGGEFDSYIIHYITSSKSEMKHLHVSRNGSGMWHFREAEEPNFPKVLDLLQHYIGKSDSKVMLRYVPPSSPMDVNLFLCRKTITEEDTEERQRNEVKSQVNLISGISKQRIIGEGRYTELHQVLWDKEPNHLQKVAVKRLKKEYSPHYLEELMEGMHRVTFWRCPTLVMVQAICLHPYQVVLEHAEHGNLEQYIKDNPMHDEDEVSIADQVAQALLYIHENTQEESGSNCGYHGNIRCRNVLVFNSGTGSQNTSIKVKLSDPGMVALYNKLPLDHVINEDRLPWIAPELYSSVVNLTANNQYSDIYSFGVFLWEVFSQGDRPFASLNIKELLKTVLYKGGLEPPEGCFQGVGELISKCLQKDIAKRPNAKEIVRDLGKVMHEFLGRGNLYNMATYGQSTYHIQERENVTEDVPEAEQNEVINSLMVQSSVTPRFESFLAHPGHSGGPQSPVSVISPSPSSFYDSRAPLLPRQSSIETNPPNSRKSRFDSDTAASGASLTTVMTDVFCDDPDSIQQRPLPSTPDEKIPLADLKHIVHPERLSVETSVTLGKGHYGQVHKAYYTLPSGQKQIVAVKSLNPVMYNRFHKEFDKECKMMTKLSHDNIVQIIGQCCEKNNHAMLLVMEFVEKGSLRDFLSKGLASAIKEHRQDPYIEQMIPKLLQFSVEIAEGMIYLSDRKIVHRDLAARNILVTGEEVMKISDFGLARNLSPDKNYYSMSDRKQEIPAYWCAPESLEARKFSTASDVWSYGVTMWEVYMFSHQPILCSVDSLYYALTVSNRRLPKPVRCPSDIYNQVMYACWDLEPEKRISFQDISAALKQFRKGPILKSTNPFMTEAPALLLETHNRTPTRNTEPKVRINAKSSPHNRDSLWTNTSHQLMNTSQSSEQSMSLPPPREFLTIETSKSHRSQHLVSSTPKGIVNKALCYERSLPEVPSESDHLLNPEYLTIMRDRKLGAGHYGEVHEGKYKDYKTAVKLLKPKMVEKHWQEFERECKMMTKLKHEHIVRIFGQCMKTVLNSKGEHQEQMVLVMEYVEKGSLKAFLRKQKEIAQKKRNSNSEMWREDLRKQLPELVGFIYQIAQGMAYLHSVDVVHRDLAARNVLVTRDNKMKISDFGLSRTLGGDKDYYRMSDQSGEIPALWCSPEALDYRKFSKKTDVWSFGVTAWEIITFGKEPELIKINLLSNALKRHHRLPKSELCNKDLYATMKMCWHLDPEQRPSFEDLLEDLKGIGGMDV